MQLLLWPYLILDRKICHTKTPPTLGSMTPQHKVLQVILMTKMAVKPKTN